MPTIDVICPVYREEEAIGRFHDRLSAALDPLTKAYTFRILYVLDPSPDRTELVLSKISASDPRVEVLVMSRRFGHQAALIAGIDHSRGDALVMLDSDLQHPPELISRLVSLWEQGAEIVQTVRMDGVETGAFRRRRGWFCGCFSSSASSICPPASISGCCAVPVLQTVAGTNPFLAACRWLGTKCACAVAHPRAWGSNYDHVFAFA